MKKTYLTVLLGIILISCLIWWLSNHHTLTRLPTFESQDTTAVAQTEKSFGQSNAKAAFVDMVSPKVETSLMLSSEERVKQMQKDLEEGKNVWRTPIEFYGKIIDENSNVVSGAQINFDCNDLSLAGTSYYQTKSDASGLFSIKDIKGKILGVYVSKEGYYSYNPHGDNFEYGDSHITSVGKEQPVVFRLRKKGIGASLVITDFPGFAHIAQLKHDGTPVELNLFQGASVSAGSGQLKLELQRDLSDKNAKKFDWKLQVSVPGGGLVATDENFPFKAVKDGYQPSIVFDMPATNQNWQGQVNNKFYIQLPDGKYGRFELMFLAYNGVFTVHSAINPSGSQNLESDSGK